MEAGSLFLDGTYASLVDGCCPNRVYAILFNKAGEAVHDAGSGTFIFQPYTKLTHAAFALVMIEDAERSKHYTYSLGAAYLAIDPTPIGEEYTLEIWNRTVLNTAYSRAQDTLLEVRPVFWTGSYLSRTRLSDSDLDSVSEYKPWVQMSYDSQLSQMHFLAWLDKDGEIQADATGVTVFWTKRDGTELMNVSLPASRMMPEQPGFWKWDLDIMDLDPDDCTPAKVTILDVDGVSHTGGAAAVSWD